MEKNTIIYVKEVNKNGKTYLNLMAETTLENGKKVDYQIKTAFFNKKFLYLLTTNLPRGAKNVKNK